MRVNHLHQAIPEHHIRYRYFTTKLFISSIIICLLTPISVHDISNEIDEIEHAKQRIYIL